MLKEVQRFEVQLKQCYYQDKFLHGGKISMIYFTNLLNTRIISEARPRKIEIEPTTIVSGSC